VLDEVGATRLQAGDGGNARHFVEAEADKVAVVSFGYRLSLQNSQTVIRRTPTQNKKDN
jgi:hypothetical protein